MLAEAPGVALPLWQGTGEVVVLILHAALVLAMLECPARLVERCDLQRLQSLQRRQWCTSSRCYDHVKSVAATVPAFKALSYNRA